MTVSMKSALVLAIAAAFASSAKASIIHYANVSSGGITVSNITETNDNGSGNFNFGDVGAPSYYGQPTLTGASLNFAITGTLPFEASSSGPNTSDLLGVKLAFDVTSTGQMPVAAFLSEVGDFFAGAGGTGGVDSSILLFSPGGTLLASSTGTVVAPGSFTSGAADTSFIWSSSAGASSNATATSFHVVIDNILHTASPSPTSFAFIEKKELSVDIGTGSGGSPGTPEPASLGLLGLGAVSLMARRRRTA